MVRLPGPRSSCGRIRALNDSFDAVFIKRALTVSGLKPGLRCSIIATAALTTGVAMLVPLKRA